MARLVFWLTLFGTLSILLIVVETKTGEITKLQLPDDVNVSLYSPQNNIRLIVNAKDAYAHCDSEIKVCGIDMCVDEINGNSEDDNNEMQDSHIVKWCFCNNIEAVLVITQQAMEAADNEFLEYRVQEVVESGCKAVECDWKLIVSTRLPNENGGNPDVIYCIRRNTCMVACEVRKSKLLQDSFNYTFLSIIAFPCVMSVLLCITFKCCTRTARASYDIQSRNLEMLPQQVEYLPPLSVVSTDNNEDGIITDEQTEDGGN